MRALSNQQRLNLINSEQLYENYAEARRAALAHKYGMRWKKVRQVEYLFRAQDRNGNGKILGRRSPQTEEILSRFTQGKNRADARLDAIEGQINEQASLNKALRLARVPLTIAAILRQLDAHDLRDSFCVLGTQALYGYEAAAGVQFLTELLASGDVDLLYDNRKKLTLTSRKLDGMGLLGLLRKVDKTFEPIRTRGFRAANAGKFMVDLIVQPRHMGETEPISFADEDLVAAEVPGLQWLLNAPKLTSIAIDESGWPTPFRVPDARAFALHKAWLSQQSSREPSKAPRDLAQAKTLARAVVELMPQLRFDEALSALHGDIRNMRALLEV